MISKIERQRSGSSICLITSMITEQIGQHKVFLSINKICYISGFFLIKTQQIVRVILLAVKISRFYAHMQWYLLSCYTVLVVLTSGQLIANQIWEFCYSYDNYELHKALIIITCQAMTNLATWGCQAKALMGEFSLQSKRYTQHRDIWIIKNKVGVKNG